MSSQRFPEGIRIYQSRNAVDGESQQRIEWTVSPDCFAVDRHGVAASCKEGLARRLLFISDEEVGHDANSYSDCHANGFRGRKNRDPSEADTEVESGPAHRS